MTLSTPDAFAVLASRFDNATGEHLTQARISTRTSTPELDVLLAESVQGGKRLRAIAAAVGALCARPAEDSFDGVTDAPLLALGAALELYQAAALVHDDLVDRSGTRRGRPSFHVALAAAHRGNLWTGDAEHFGVAGAILAGDFLLAAADTALEQAGTDGTLRDLSGRFALMTREVAHGQYLDLRNSHTDLGEETAVERALEIVRLKSARYSVAHPAVLGAISGGAGPELQGELEEIFELVGIAFQLRDDDLGVFGNPDHTGKPVSSDIAERKRTVLLALTFAAADEETQAFLQRYYRGDDEDNQAISHIRGIMDRYGRPLHEEMIADYRQRARSALERLALSPQARRQCQELIDRLIVREA